MSNSVIGALRVTLGMDSAAFTEGLSAAQKQMQDVGKRMQRVGTGLATIGAGLTATVTLPALAMGRALMEGATSAAHAAGQVQAALASMGDGAGRTFDQLTAQAERLSATSLFDDDDILTKVTANLLTFGNIAGSAFDRAQQAAVNLSAGLGQDLQSATMMLGKALDNPVKGMNALTRAGVSLSPAIQQNIKDLVAQGRTLEAQSIILDAVERQFRDRAQEARNADPMAAAMIDLGRAMGVLEQHFVPVIAALGRFVSQIADGLTALTPFQQKMVLIGGAVAAAIGPALVAIGAVVGAIGLLVASPLLPFIAAAVAAVAALGAAFWIFRDDIIPVLQSFGRSLQDNLGPKLAPLWDAIVAAARLVGSTFAAIFGEGSPESVGTALKWFGEFVARVFGAVVELITGAINVVTNVLRAIGALLRGDFSTMWNALGSAVGAMARAIWNAFATMAPGVTDWVRRTYEGVKTWLLDRFTAIVRGIGEKVGQVTGFFRDMYVAVVGNSFVPDMVREIGEWVAKLDGNMVQPIHDATDAAASAFGDMSDSIGGQVETLFKSIASKDWKGALGGLFDILGGQGGTLGNLGNLGKSLMSFLPGFARGGSFNVAGSGTTDSKVVAFRATPGERVDISTPGQRRSEGGPAGFVFHVDKSPLFDAHVTKVAGPMAAQAYSAAVQTARKAMPGDLHRLRRHSFV